ncbi:MAG: hypothetical protein GC162_20520 [Planctomycetes bacterium]|nr:hypothetical protein [Planctomycetota bacterium]
MSSDDPKPRNFRLSSGRSDLSLLFAAFVFGAILIWFPDAEPWITRILLVFVAGFLLHIIITFRGLPAYRRAHFNGPVWGAIGIVQLLVYVYALIRMFGKGQWIDAILWSILVTEIAVLEWRFAFGPDDIKSEHALKSKTDDREQP